MTPWLAERSMWVGAVVLILVSAIEWRDRGYHDATSDLFIYEGNGVLLLADSSALALAAERIVARDPFRLDRRPPQVRFDPNPNSPPGPPPPPPRTPSPTLVGISGPPWQAILEGVPGREGAVVTAVGGTPGGLTVVRITRDSVIIEAADTVFALTVRRAWR